MEESKEDYSFLNPQPPTLIFGNRNFLAPRKLHFTLLEEEEQENINNISGNVRVYLRIKPATLSLASEASQEETFRVKNSQTLIGRTAKDSVTHEFQFTKVFKAQSSQEEVYNETVHDLVKKFIDGQNCLLFAYGTSNAGKTYTVQGNPREPGILPRAINTVFNSIKGRAARSCKFKPDMVSRILYLDENAIQQELAYKQKIMTWSQDKSHGSDQSQSSKSSYTQLAETSLDSQSEPTFVSLDSQDITNNFREMESRLSNLSLDMNTETNKVFSVWVSFAEIYNENVYDLLEPIAVRGQRRPNLPLGQDSSGQVYIKGLRHIWINSGEEAYQAMMYGQHNLKFAPTGLNSVSSRSHCIFTIKLLQFKDADMPRFITVSMFSFCDLAGAERLKHTHNAGERLRESQNINTSLHVLGRCLRTIRDNQVQRNKKLIPFRDSKLTRLFQRALTGKETVIMIVNVNVSHILRDETFNVLNFSAVAKQIILQPEKHRKRIPRASRFSQYIAKDQRSNSSREGNISSSTSLSVYESEALRGQIEKLTTMVENLKACLSAERKEKLNTEKRIREELCDHFSKKMAEQQSYWETEVENTEIRYEEISEWKVNKLTEYYEKQLSRKRHRDEDSDDDDDGDRSSSILEIHKEIEYLKDKLNIANELSNIEREEKKKLIEKNSELSMSLAHCQNELKNTQKIVESMNSNRGDGNALELELQNQLKTAKEELEKKQTKIEELEGVLEDAKVDFDHLEKDYNSIEKERNDLLQHNTQLETENKQNLMSLQHTQKLLDAQSLRLDQKDDCISNLEKQLNELKSEKECLTSKLKESEEQNLSLEKLNEVQQKEISELTDTKDTLEDKLHCVEKAQKDAIKSMVKTEKLLEEQKKLTEEIKRQSQNEVSQMKIKLQSYTDTAALVKSMKEEIENKSSKYDKLELENDSLKKALDTKEIEMARFIDNRNEMLKRYEDLVRKEKEESDKHKREVSAYQQMFSKNTPTPNKKEFEAKIQKLQNALEMKDKELARAMEKVIKLQAKQSKYKSKDDSEDEEYCTKTTRRNRKKLVDENTYPTSQTSSERRCLRRETRALETKRNDPPRSRSRKRMLFSDNGDEDEIVPIEVEEEPNPGNLQPERLLRSRRV